MKYRQLGKTELNVSEVGFGVWTVAMNWWGKIEEPQGINLLRQALDLGVNFFDTGDAYGDGYGEEILAKALKQQRHDIVIGTKFGYDFYTPFIREGHQERPQKWTPGFVRYACEQSLRRLDTDYIDLYQLHNPKMDAIEDDELYGTLDELVNEGKILHYGFAIGPGHRLGRRGNGGDGVSECPGDADNLQHPGAGPGACMVPDGGAAKDRPDNASAACVRNAGRHLH